MLKHNCGIETRQFCIWDFWLGSKHISTVWTDVKSFIPFLLSFLFRYQYGNLVRGFLYMFCAIIELQFWFYSGENVCCRGQCPKTHWLHVLLQIARHSFLLLWFRGISYEISNVFEYFNLITVLLVPLFLTLLRHTHTFGRAVHLFVCLPRILFVSVV